MENNKIKVGDVVICINNGNIGVGEYLNPPLKINGEYVVQAINICPCGSIKYDVGLTRGCEMIQLCVGCTRKVHGDSIWWCNPKRFIKKDTRSFAERITEAIETENYELAKELTDKKNTK